MTVEPWKATHYFVAQKIELRGARGGEYLTRFEDGSEGWHEGPLVPIEVVDHPKDFAGPSVDLLRFMLALGLVKRVTESDGSKWLDADEIAALCDRYLQRSKNHDTGNQPQRDADHEPGHLQPASTHLGAANLR
jgi:hypothetical protein